MPDTELNPVTRGRGRPSRSIAQRERILDAAETLFVEQPGIRLSLRAIARQANVTAALLNYHFSDLEGLLRTLLNERAQPLWRALFESGDTDAGTALTCFLQRWTVTLLRHRWLLPCLLRIPAGGEWGAQLRELVHAAQSEGTLRRDLPADYIAMLLLSVGALPQLAHTALGCGIALPSDATAASQLTLQHLSLLEHGLRARRP